MSNDNDFSVKTNHVTSPTYIFTNYNPNTNISFITPNQNKSFQRTKTKSNWKKPKENLRVQKLVVEFVNKLNKQTVSREYYCQVQRVQRIHESNNDESQSLWSWWVTGLDGAAARVFLVATCEHASVLLPPMTIIVHQKRSACFVAPRLVLFVGGV